jgi:hypothetical protein
MGEPLFVVAVHKRLKGCLASPLLGLSERMERPMAALHDWLGMADFAFELGGRRERILDTAMTGELRDLRQGLLGVALFAETLPPVIVHDQAIDPRGERCRLLG